MEQKNSRPAWQRRIARFFCSRKIHVNPRYAGKDFPVASLPDLFARGEGILIHDGRNQLREMEWEGIPVIVKSYCIPNFINRIVYGNFRASKAERSYRYAALLRKEGIGSPEPVAWMTERRGLFFGRSYFVCLKSRCPHTFVDLMGGRYPGQERYLRAIARTTAALHGHGMVHKDYSRGNILFGDGPDGVEVEVIDLNRIRFYRSVSMEEGCRNFAERLPSTPEMLAVMADGYARARGFDSGDCLRLMEKYTCGEKG